MKRNVKNPGYCGRRWWAIMMSIALLFLVCSTSIASINAAHTAITKEARIAAIKGRVTEIRKMNYRQMSATERAEVKSELKDMRDEVRQLQPAGVYVSGTALIVIIILLILLL